MPKKLIDADKLLKRIMGMCLPHGNPEFSRGFSAIEDAIKSMPSEVAFDADWVRDRIKFSPEFEIAWRMILQHFEQRKGWDVSALKRPTPEGKAALEKEMAEQPKDKLEDMIFMRGAQWEDDIETLIFEEFYKRLKALEGK